MKTAAVKIPRTKPAEIRREDLMDAAEKLFLEKGFATTSVSEIVSGAGVAKGTFYTYFGTKDDVVTALQARFIDGFCEKVDAALAEHSGSWPEKLDIWVQTCVTIYLDNVDVHDLVFHQHNPSNRQLKSENPVIMRLDAMLSQGAQAGAWAAGNETLKAVMLFNALHGAVDVCLATVGEIDADALSQTIKVFFRSVLNVSDK